MIYKTTSTLSKLFHYAVGLVRRDSGSTSMGFLKALGETLFGFVVMAVIMLLLRGIGVKIRGEFGFYILIGICLFMVHSKIIGTLTRKKGTDPMLPVLAISRGMMIVSSVLYEVYMQFCMLIILFLMISVYYGSMPVDNWMLLIYCYLLTILWSTALGVFFLALMPIAPPIINKIATIYKRIGIVTSGKMIPGNMLAMMGRFGGIFIYNPLFHLIDQARGAMFLNYVPNTSNLTFPIEATAVLFFISAICYFALKDK